jgi:peroxiredoxin
LERIGIVAKWVSFAALALGLLALVSVLAGCGVGGSSNQAPSLLAAAAMPAAPLKVSDFKAAGSLASEPEPQRDALVKSLPEGTQPGYLALDFTLPDAEGQDVSLADYRGKPVVMIFWASWCPYCRKEMPLLENLYQEHADQGLVVLGVNLLGSKGETQERALAFAEDNNLTFPILFDVDGEVFRHYRGRGVPNLLFVDRQGVIVANHPGAVGAQDLEALIQQLVETE